MLNYDDKPGSGKPFDVWPNLVMWVGTWLLRLV